MDSLFTDKAERLLMGQTRLAFALKNSPHPGPLPRGEGEDTLGVGTGTRV
jgi:hypothetical protein